MAKGKLLKFKGRFKFVKDYDLHFGIAHGKFRTAAGNALSADRRIRSIKVARNTYSASRKNYFKNTKGKMGVMSLDLFTKGLAKRLNWDMGTALASQRNVELSRAGQLKKLAKMRRDSGKQAVKSRREMNNLIKPRSNPDRMVNARSKGVIFRYVKGRGLVPMRPKKKR
jgi:hypothetical protein